MLQSELGSDNPNFGNMLLGIIVGAIMLASSAIFFLKLQKIKAPRNSLALLIAIFQLPVTLLVHQYLADSTFNLWEVAISTFVLELNCIGISIMILSYAMNTQSTYKPLSGLFIVPVLLLNFTPYGKIFWQQIFSESIASNFILIISFILEVYFFVRAENSDSSLEPEAYTVLGKETISGLVLVPTWGTILILYPIAFLYAIIVNT